MLLIFNPLNIQTANVKWQMQHIIELLAKAGITTAEIWTNP